ncbi:MAG: class I SAM-dependent methyltransferase [Robiginitomaculum sp.]|nr:class I SAM-dependent methyltransferase [Robiginitomaculum sp.]
MADTSKLFSDKSDIYAQARPQYPAELFDFIKTLPKQTGTVWDCATGNGQAAIGLAQVFDQVYATDISTEQIANRLDVANVNFSVCPAEQTGFADNMFDVVNVAQALHWFDFDRFWPEVRRVLKPGGVFITYAYAWFAVTPAIDALVESEIKTVVAPYWAAQNQLVADHYKDVVFPFEKIEVPEIELTAHWDFEHLMNFLHSWSATRRCMDDKGSVFFEQARAKLLQAWGDPADVKLATSPLMLIAGYPEMS